MSKIEWTDKTWITVTGCDKVSAGCRSCYAETMSERWKAAGNHKYRNGFELTLHEKTLEQPLGWRRPRKVFVNSMSDTFHEGIPLDFIQRMFDTMARCPRHIFQVLTKRSKRLREVASQLPWHSNIWIGVSVEDERVMHRIYDLQEVPAQVRFLSCEPLIGPLNQLPLEGIHWVIVGGESGVRAREMKFDWVEDVVNQCRREKVPVFVKQMGKVLGKSLGMQGKGGDFERFPESVMVREFPAGRGLLGL